MKIKIYYFFIFVFLFKIDVAFSAAKAVKSAVVQGSHVLPPSIPRNELPEYFKPGSSHPLGVRPDCSEKKADVSLLESLGSRSDITDINDFLKGIPEGMFQTFTLVTNSRSAQKGEGAEAVSEEWPRVLRTTADGKITFSYTCNPKSSTHNTVEVMYFDEKTKKTRTVSINLNAKEKESRVHHDDKKCLSCHGTAMPDGSVGAKYIWPEYFQWGGCKGKDTINLYGSNDDNMHANQFRSDTERFHEYKDCSIKDLEEKKLKEIEAFEKFKEKNLGTGKNNNPCYSSLPWAKAKGPASSQYDPNKFGAYPYASDGNHAEASANSDNKENYYLRTNLRFTEMYARQNAMQIYGAVAKSPRYNSIKYFLGLEAAGCLKPEDEAEINDIFPNMNFKFKEKRALEGSDPDISSPLLYSYAKSIGIKDADWSLEFKAKSKRYTAAIPRKANPNSSFSQDTGMAEIASALVVRELESESSDLKTSMSDGYTRGAAEGFGEQWSCLDDGNGAIRETHQGHFKPVCKNLRDLLTRAKIENPENFCTRKVEVSAVASSLRTNAVQVINEISNDRKKRGSEIISDRCVWCHLTEKQRENIKKGDAIPQNVSDVIKKKLSRSDILTDNIKFGIMPEDSPPLSDQDKEDVLLYLNSLQ